MDYRYPLGEHERERIVSRTGKKLADITLDEVLKGHISSDDIKIAPETLKAQGQVAAEWAVAHIHFMGRARRIIEQFLSAMEITQWHNTLI